MFFIPRNNILFSLMIKFSPLQRYIFTFLLGALLIFIGIVIHKKINSHIKSYSKKICHLNKEILFLSKDKPISLDSMEKKLHSLNKGDLQSQLSFILKLVTKIGLVLNSYIPNLSTDKDWYVKNKVLLDINGNFSKILLFFEELKLSKKLIQCRKIKLSRVKDDILNAQFALNCFILK